MGARKVDGQIKQLESVQALRNESAFAVAILANPDTGEFKLVNPEPLPAHLALEYTKRGLTLCGVIGVSPKWVPRAELIVNLEAALLEAIADAFIQLVNRAIEKSGLDRLHSLPDTRTLPN
jgi:hypothetical protein